MKLADRANMSRTQLRHYKGYLYRLLKGINGYYPEYEPKAGDGLAKLLNRYFMWVYDNNNGFLPQSLQNNSDAVWLMEQYNIWLNR